LWTITCLHLKRDRRGVSNIIVVVLSLVIIVAIISNIVLWSYEMNQLDWEKMKEDMSITNVERVNHSSWFVAQNEYTVNTGSRTSGAYTDTQAVDDQYERFMEASTILSYNPSGYTVGGSTSWVSGSVSDLTSDNGVYMVFRSYASATTGQTLYAHQETTTIGGTTYRLQKLDSADAAGTSLSASMAATGRQLFGKFVYPLTGVSSIPASTWTMYYRGWRDTTPSIAFDAVSSGNNGGGSTSVSWSHTTGSGWNRIMIVGVSIRTTTVSVLSITYGAQSLTFLRADTHPSATIRSELWYLIAPASGTATVTVTLSGTSKATGGSCTYTGVAQTSPLDANNGGTGTSNSPSQSVTVNTANSWLLGHLAISGSSRTVSSEGSGQTQRWDRVTTGGGVASRNRGHGSDKGPVGTGSQTMSWTLSGSADWAVSVVAFKPASSPVGHADVDILIRQSDGTIRTTIATDVADSSDLATSPTTLLGNYSFAEYAVVDQTDYLEIDCYVEVTTALSGISAYLRIDDNTLAIADQARVTSIMLPSEFTAEVEFTGTSNTATWTQLVWTVDSCWTTANVNVTLQLYNYTSGSYPTSGDGYISYISSATPNTDETKTQTIVTNSTHFRDGSGNWTIKVKGVKTTTTQFDFKADWIEFKTNTADFYSLDIAGTVTIDVSIYPLAYVQTIEIQLRYRADDAGEKWYLKAYNWSSSTYSDSGFNSTVGHTPTTGWDYYAVNLTDEWRSYVRDNGTIYVKFVDEGADSNQTTIDIDFLGVRAEIDGTRFTFENEGALTSHLVSLWIINSTNHQRYDINIFVNSAETTTYLRADISLPTGQYAVKAVTERGNTAIYSGS